MLVSDQYALASAQYQLKKLLAPLKFLTLKKHFTPKNAFYTNKKKAPAALGQALKNEVLMRIGITAAQNDERGDQGLARTVDKQR